MRSRAVLAAACAAAAAFGVAGTAAAAPPAAARSAELVLPGQPDLERLQADPGPDYSDPASSRRSRSGRSR